jgi:5-methylcytosine-specific restriction endonuclease McrA
MDPSFEWTTKTEKLRVIAYWWKEQGGKCCLCGLKMLKYGGGLENSATVEHVIPKRENGPNTVGNVRLAHARCNHVAGALWEQRRQMERRPR